MNPAFAPRHTPPDRKTSGGDIESIHEGRRCSGIRHEGIRHNKVRRRGNSCNGEVRRRCMGRGRIRRGVNPRKFASVAKSVLKIFALVTVDDAAVVVANVAVPVNAEVPETERRDVVAWVVVAKVEVKETSVEDPGKESPLPVARLVNVAAPVTPSVPPTVALFDTVKARGRCCSRSWQGSSSWQMFPLQKQGEVLECRRTRKGGCSGKRSPALFTVRSVVFEASTIWKRFATCPVKERMVSGIANGRGRFKSEDGESGGSRRTDR